MSDRTNDLAVSESELCAQWRVFGLRPNAAADRLAERIPALCDATGALPTQEVLAQALGVSRSLLREAVSRLVARGVVDVRTKVGSRVVDERRWQIVDRHVVGWRLARATDPAFVADITEIRRVLEPIAAADTAQHASPEQRAQITGASAMRLTATSLPDYTHARRQLHVAILAASSNQFLRQLTCLVPLQDCQGNLHARAPMLADGERDALTLLEAAIRHGDADAAREAIERLNAWDLPRAGGAIDG